MQSRVSGTHSSAQIARSQTPFPFRSSGSNTGSLSHWSLAPEREREADKFGTALSVLRQGPIPSAEPPSTSMLVVGLLAKKLLFPSPEVLMVRKRLHQVGWS